MNISQKEALVYIWNTKGSATLENFLEDFEPIGNQMWASIHANGWATVNDDGNVILTEYGNDVLD